MKHEGIQFSTTLPDAPLTMPRQSLERPRPWLKKLRAMLSALPRLPLRP